MLEFIHVRKNHGGHRVLDDVSFTIGRGAFFAILGPSGCGKTTLLKAIAGLETIDKGSIRFEGKSLEGVPPYARPFHLVFQKYALFPHLNVAGNVGFGLRFKSLTRAERENKIGKALDLVHLAGFEKRSIETLSGGQAQRVALARSLILEPKVLLLDEPLAALDPMIKQSMQMELKELQRRVGVTFVMVTHDQEEALFLADQIAVMNQGRMEQCGSPDLIYGRPESKFVAHFVGEMNELKGSVQSIHGEVVGLSVNGSDQLLFASLPSSTKRHPEMHSRVNLLIRPEHLILTPNSMAHPSTGLSATVTSLSFRGPMTRIELMTQSPEPLSLIAYVLGHGIMGSGTMEIGASVFVSFGEKHATILGEPR